MPTILFCGVIEILQGDDSAKIAVSQLNPTNGHTQDNLAVIATSRLPFHGYIREARVITEDGINYVYVRVSRPFSDGILNGGAISVIVCTHSV
jgi:hypothetical protein